MLRNESVSLWGLTDFRETKDDEAVASEGTLHPGCLWENANYWIKCLGMRRAHISLGRRNDPSTLERHQERRGYGNSFLHLGQQSVLEKLSCLYPRVRRQRWICHDSFSPNYQHLLLSSMSFQASINGPGTELLVLLSQMWLKHFTDSSCPNQCKNFKNYH